MQRLTVDNFLVIQQADIECRQFNVFVGPQATGKSLILKLLWFFKHGVGRCILDTMRDAPNSTGFEERMEALFCKVFPQQYWAQDNFNITFQDDEFLVTVIRIKKKGRKSETSCRVTLSGKLHQLAKTALDMAHTGPTKREELGREARPGEPYRLAYNYLRDSKYAEYFAMSAFIPASRSFFANLQKNVFAFIADNIDIDPFLKEYGSLYEQSKRLYHDKWFWDRAVVKKLEPIRRELNEIAERVLAGQYVVRNGLDYIESGSRCVNLSNASSGQQESLPMLVTLNTLLLSRIGTRLSVFIEEPEAHLFPASQRLVAEWMSALRSATGHQFFITTHSPYLLAALNNLILAHDLYSEMGRTRQERLVKIIPENQLLAWDAVGAWTVTDGIVRSIKDDEGHVVGLDIIDQVSEDFDAVANDLLAASRIGGPKSK